MSTPLDCRSDRRREDVLAVAAERSANGIDYVEVDPADHRVVRVFFLLPLPPADPGDPASEQDAYGLAAAPGQIEISGGVRVVGIKALEARRRVDPATHPDPFLEVSVDRAGDHSPYEISLSADVLDPRRRRAPLSFMASCPVDHDCARSDRCPPPQREEPELDYMAKDYSSFRRMMFDLLPRLNPAWRERSPVDLGTMLVELLAHEGDQLSYLQDAVANEAYLETARRRRSVRRHAKLVDYRVHEGRNSWTWLRFEVSQAQTVPARTPVITRIAEPLAGRSLRPGTAIVQDAAQPDAPISVGRLESDPALQGAVVFETARALRANPLENRMLVHTWGEEECCLPRGATEAFVYARRGGGAVRPSIEPGDHVLLEEVTGVRADARDRPDPSGRAVVTVLEAEGATDPLYRADLNGDELQLRESVDDEPLPLRRIRWGDADALQRPLCLSVRTSEDEILREVTVARGNVVAADQGLTTTDELEPDRRGPEGPGRLRLRHGPLTWQQGRFRPGGPAAPSHGDPDPDGRLAGLSDSADMALPAIEVTARRAAGSEVWQAVPDLLDSTPFERHFAVEVDDDGRAVLRFGDGRYGRALGDPVSLSASYRVGIGAAGNVGANSIEHVVVSGDAAWIVDVTNPLPASGGVDPEPLDAVRRDAPVAFHASQLRAVTADDYRQAAGELDRVASAVASFRWTGSWQTVFVGIDPRDRSDLKTDVRGRASLSEGLRQEVRARLARRRLAGRDVQVLAPEYVPVELGLEVCVDRDHFRGDVALAVSEALSDRSLPGGRAGLFHPDSFGFGDPVYLSRVYAAAVAVPGVDSAVVRRFRRYRERDAGELERGVLAVGPWEVAQLRNDPDFPEHGVLEIATRGGKA